MGRLLKRLKQPCTGPRAQRDLVLGTSSAFGEKKPVVLPESSRSMHIGVMGLSGVGKSYFLENLIRQDIDQGTGFVVFDVHGDLADSIVAYIAERARNNPESLRRAVIIEPFDPTYSIGFNPLEGAPPMSPFIQAQELAHILRSRWETQSFGARTEELLRSALYTLSARGLTLVELPHLPISKAFRSELVKQLEESAVAEYWTRRYEQMSDRMKAAVREPLLTRVSAFLADPQVREIVGQEKSTVSFREAIANRRWIVINLSKGKLGENSGVLGSLLFTKLELDVMGQAQTPETERRLFVIYADELQNLVGQNFATLIAEARKYNISITAGHQYWRQLAPDMRAAMLGVETRVFFRLHYHDARELAGELNPREKEWYTEMLTGLGRGEAVGRIGSASPARFAVEAHRKPTSTRDEIEEVRKCSRSFNANARWQIRNEIQQRYRERVRAEVARRVSR